MKAAPVDRHDTTRVRPVRHAGGCGLRIRSPHDDCQSLVDPFLAAEVVVVRHGGQTSVVTLAADGGRWRRDRLRRLDRPDADQRDSSRLAG